MRRGANSGRENSICKGMLAGENMSCSRNVSLVLLEHEVGQKDKEGEMATDGVDREALV